MDAILRGRTPHSFLITNGPCRGQNIKIPAGVEYIVVRDAAGVRRRYERLGSVFVYVGLLNGIGGRR